MPALKVHKEKQGNNIYARPFFSLCSGLCLRLRFTRKARKNSFCATRLVPASKVHRESTEKDICATRPLPAPRVHSESNFVFCAARPVPALKVHKEKQGNNIHARLFFSLCSGLCVRLRFTKKARKSCLVVMR